MSGDAPSRPESAFPNRLPQPRIPSGRVEPEVAIRARRRDATAGRAIQEANLDQKRLVNVFDGVFFFADGGGDRVETDRPPAELVDDSTEQFAVDLIEAVLVDLEQF